MFRRVRQVAATEAKSDVYDYIIVILVLREWYGLFSASCDDCKATAICNIRLSG